MDVFGPSRGHRERIEMKANSRCQNLLLHHLQVLRERVCLIPASTDVSHGRACLSCGERQHSSHGNTTDIEHIEKTSNTLEQRIRVVLLVTAPQYQHARKQSAAVSCSAPSGSKNFPGQTSTIATVSGVRRKTGLDVQIRVTAVQHD